MADKAYYSLLIDLVANVAKLQSDMDKAVGVLRRATGLMGNITRGFAEGFGKDLERYAIDGVKRLASAMTDLAEGPARRCPACAFLPGIDSTGTTCIGTAPGGKRRKDVVPKPRACSPASNLS